MLSRGSTSRRVRYQAEQDARNFVVSAIEAGDACRCEFDLDAICDELRKIAGSWNFESVNHDTFWAVIEQWRWEELIPA